MKISPARTAAFDILLRIEKDQAYSSVLLPFFEAKLQQNDRSLCHQLVLGCLRRQMYLDGVIEILTKGRKIDIEIRIALRLALYQLYYLDRVPQYSAINESVNLVQRARKISAKSFVNAVLRRAAAEPIELAHADEIERLSVETSHPRWLIERWIGDFGIEEASKLAMENNEVADTAFRVLSSSADGVEKLMEDSRPSAHVSGCRIALSNEHQIYALAERGDVYIQDEASQMVAQAVPISQGANILDVCASPGGKVGLIARNAGGNAWVVAAGDLHAARVRILKENCQHQGVSTVGIVQYDAEKVLPFADESFDAVLVDAPCSGTGTIRHNPEIRYSVTEKDLIELPDKQLSILINASKLVSLGGSLVYSTCSLEREEDEGVCKNFLVATDGFELVKPNVPESLITDEGFVRTFPHRDGMDGFFLAEFRRI